jgi:hypothetical protein
MIRSSLLAICVVVAVASTQDRPSEKGAVRAEMRNIFYHYTDTITAHIVYLQGDLIPSGTVEFPIFEDPNSFAVDAHAAEISITTAALANVLNQYAFAAPDAPIKSIRVSTQGQKLKVQGRLRSGGVPFESEGSLAVTPEGEIRVHSEKIKAVHVPVKGLMDLLGKNISKLIDTRKVNGIRAENNDLILNPAELFPPPHIHGKLSAVAVRGNEVVLKYGGAPAPSLKIAGNYMAYRGAQLRFGKLTMHDTDLILIDLDPQDPLDFFLAHYWDQLAAGYTKITPTFGLRTYIRDYNKLKQKQKAAGNTVSR